MVSLKHQHVIHKAVEGCNNLKQFRKKQTLVSTGKGRQEMKENANKQKWTA